MFTVPRHLERPEPQAGVAPRSWSLAHALQRAVSMREIATAVVSYLGPHSGCDDAVVAWWMDGAPSCQQVPHAQLGAADQALMQEAMEVEGSSLEPIGGSSRFAFTVRSAESSAWAVVIGSSVDLAARDAFFTMLVPRIAHALEIERLREVVTRLQNAERLQRALYAIADLASSDLDMPEMLRAIHDIVGGLMYAENFFIVLRDPERQTFRFIYFADTKDSNVFDPEFEWPASALENSLTLGVIRHGKPVMGPSDHVREQLGLPIDESFGPDSEDWLGVPMVVESEARGAIVVQSYDRAVRYTDEDRALLSYVAQHILTALLRKQAHGELERRVEQRTRELAEANQVLTLEVQERQRGEKLQAALFSIAELASTTDSLTQFYAAVHATVGELLYARNFLIALLTEEGGELEFPYAVDERDPLSSFRRRKLASGLTEWVLRRGKSLLADRAQIENLTARGEVHSFGSPSVCWLGVPLICDEQPVGVVVVQSYSAEHTYSLRDQELLTFVSYQIANGLQRKRAQESLQSAYADLEHRVDERTRELADTNRELLDQISVREHMELKLKHEALHDALTGLPNRGFLLDRLGRALSRFRHDAAHPFAVLFLDLDRFKVVNDSVGHLVGDEMLKEAGIRLQHCVREPDVVARLGGDEFAILLQNLHSTAAPGQVADRIIQALSEPMRIAGKELFTSASVGIAVAAARYQSAEELLRDADVAMYRAKARGRQRYELFDERLHEEALNLLDLEGDLRRAIMRREFEPHFQAIVRLSDGEVVGYEALLRWRHAERGLLLPADFLGVAEESGNIEQIDWQMFAMTFREVPRLARDGKYVSINVSARHFRSPDLAPHMLELLRESNVAPSSVRIEVTEGALLEQPEQIRATLEQLRSAGVLTSLDDFGTGYSSLSYLHRFPLHSLKVDRSFIADLRAGATGGSVPVVRAIHALARSLGMEVIAEGIETTEQRDVLIELGCKYGQGFLYAHPRPAGKFLTDR